MDVASPPELEHSLQWDSAMWIWCGGTFYSTVQTRFNDYRQSALRHTPGCTSCAALCNHVHRHAILAFNDHGAVGC